jgi:prolyl 4-hydroxylase
MGTSTQLTPEWEQWIVDNIARGVPLPALIEEMVKNNFDLMFATTAVAQRAPDFAAIDLAQATQPFQYPIPAGFEQHYVGYCYDRKRIASGNQIEIDGHIVKVLGRIAEPDIVIFENVLTAAECDELIKLSTPKLTRSTIVDDQTGAAGIVDSRSSEGTYFLRGENTFVARIEKRLAKLIDMPVDNGEGLQILHYRTGAEYRPHYDFFSPENPGSAVHLAKGGQRVATLVMYLSDVDEGGETIFPEIGFSVAPRKGGAVYFSYCDTESRLDRATLHGGAPVTVGEKWIATHWVRQGAYF